MLKVAMTIELVGFLLFCLGGMGFLWANIYNKDRWLPVVFVGFVVMVVGLLGIVVGALL